MMPGSTGAGFLPTLPGERSYKWKNAELIRKRETRYATSLLLLLLLLLLLVVLLRECARRRSSLLVSRDFIYARLRNSVMQG